MPVKYLDKLCSHLILIPGCSWRRMHSFRSKWAATHKNSQWMSIMLEIVMRKRIGLPFCRHHWVVTVLASIVALPNPPRLWLHMGLHRRDVLRIPLYRLQAQLCCRSSVRSPSPERGILSKTVCFRLITWGENEYFNKAACGCFNFWWEKIQTSSETVPPGAKQKGSTKYALRESSFMCSSLYFDSASNKFANIIRQML